MSTTRRAAAPQKRQPRITKKAKRWSQRVTNTSNALDLESGVFKNRAPKAIARSLKRSAEESQRRKTSPYRSAMSMLNFYVNRGGKQLTVERKRVLERAKEELRVLFGRE
jgi:putative cell wall-binding protein